MSRKLKYTLVCIFILVVTGSVLLIEPSKEYLFLNAKGSCHGRTVLMYNAIYRNLKEPDVSLFGSSRMMHCVNDSLLNAMRKAQYLNLSYCMFGRNLDCFFAEQYCLNHKPKKIVFEIRGSEENTSHKLSPFL